MTGIRNTFTFIVPLVSTIIFGAGSALAEGYFCSVDTVCSDQHSCYANEYVWDMHIVPTDAGWVFTYDPDDGSRDIYQEIEGANGDSGALFLMRTQSQGENVQVTMFTIWPDLRLAISSHYTEKFSTAETAFGSCEAVE